MITVETSSELGKRNYCTLISAVFHCMHFCALYFQVFRCHAQLAKYPITNDSSTIPTSIPTDSWQSRLYQFRPAPCTCVCVSSYVHGEHEGRYSAQRPLPHLRIVLCPAIIPNLLHYASAKKSLRRQSVVLLSHHYFFHPNLNESPQCRLICAV